MACPNIQKAAAGDGGGVLIQTRAIRIRDIKDGSTNTFLIGEALGLASGTRDHIPPEVYAWGGQSISEVCGDTRRPINAGTGDSFCVNNFSSNHKGGAQFCCADGAVRFVSEDIHFAQTNTNSTQGLFQNLADRRDLYLVPDAFAHD